MTLENIAEIYNALPIWALVTISLWTLLWKGLALWKSARLKKPIWFVVLLVVNTFGILEILYLFIFSEMGKKNANKVQKAPKRKTSRRSKS